MRISKTGGRRTPTSLWKRKALSYLAITGMFFVIAALNSAPTIPLYFDHAMETSLLMQEGKDQPTVVSLNVNSTPLSTQLRQSDPSAVRPMTPTPTPSTSLRLDWTNQVPKSPLAKRMKEHQNNCSLPLGNFKFRNRFGLGSDLHIWSQALCNAVQYKVRIRTVWDWLWMDQQSCGTSDDGQRGSPMQCYFPHAELQCPNDMQMVQDHPIFDSALFNISGGRRQGTVHWDCPSILSSNNTIQDRLDFQQAAMEYLFGHLSPLVAQEAKRQHGLVFRGPTPSNLITVHIRWGDKKREMKLVRMREYINAIQELVQQQPRPIVNIFLATEDPEAVQHFRQTAPSDWSVYLDHFYSELLPHRNGEYNGVPKAATALEGRMGTIALGSLLVALEANEYVLTTDSNWSRLLNELRQAVVDPSCQGCTKVVDLRPIKSL